MPPTTYGDGLIQVTAAINDYGLLATDGIFGATQITLAPNTPAASMNLKVDDLLLIIQMQGAVIDHRDSSSYGTVLTTNGTGRFEFIGVKAIADDGVTVSLYDFCGGLQNTYPAAGSQVVRVPHYRSLLIKNGISLTSKPWDGKMGGIVAVKVDGTLTIDGLIDASGQGFRGGALNANTQGRIPGFGAYYLSLNPLDGGNKGEGLAGGSDVYALTGAFGRGAPANGGGGGNRMLAGGGGGGNGDNGHPWSGQGVMQSISQGQQLGWPLDPGYIANANQYTDSSGGGRGGYSYSQQFGDPRTLGPGSLMWSGDFRRERGGLGGRPVANDLRKPNTRLFLGGGGGAGDNYQSAGGAGGSGGGMIFLVADNVTGAGAIKANGTAGLSTPDRVSGAGGGGAGGTIVVASNQIGDIEMYAVGGAGGNQSGSGASSLEAAGPGGGGGGGFIATPASAEGLRDVDGGSRGFSTEGFLQSFPENGATDGAAGKVADVVAVPFGGALFCTTADLSVQLSSGSAETSRRDPVTYTITINNRGPSSAANLQVTLTLPDTGDILEADGNGWTCTPKGALLTCTRASLDSGTSSAITVQARPPLSTTAALATARVQAHSVDDNLVNNIAETSITITDPLSAYGLGGGFSCQAARHTEGSAPSAWGMLAMLLLLLPLRRQAAMRSKQ